MKHTLFRVVTKVTIFATVFLLVLGMVTPVAYAATFDDVEMQLSRVQASATPSTTFVIDLPSGVDWDATTASDTIIVDFSDSPNFNVAGTWTSTDIEIADIVGNHSVSTTDSNLVQSSVAGTYTFLSSCVGTQNSLFFQVAVNTADEAIKFKLCGGGGAPDPGSGGEIKITLRNKGNGTLTLPGSASDSLLTDVSMTGDATYSDTLATSVISQDSSAPSAVAPTSPTMTFELSQDRTANSSSLQSCDSGVTSYDVGFTTPLSYTHINNATSTICTSVTSTAGSIATVYTYSLYGGLTSDSGSTFIATAVHSNSTEVSYSSASTRDDGVCVLIGADFGVGSGISGNVTSTGASVGTCGWQDGANATGTQKFFPLTKITIGMKSLWSAQMTSSGAYAHVLSRVGLTSGVAPGTYSDTRYFVASSAF